MKPITLRVGTPRLKNRARVGASKLTVVRVTLHPSKKRGASR